MGGSGGAASHLPLCLPCKLVLSLPRFHRHLARRAQFPAFRPGRNPMRPHGGHSAALGQPLRMELEEIATIWPSLGLCSLELPWLPPAEL